MFNQLGASGPQALCRVSILLTQTLYFADISLPQNSYCPLGVKGGNNCWQKNISADKKDVYKIIDAHT